MGVYTFNVDGQVITVREYPNDNYKDIREWINRLELSEDLFIVPNNDAEAVRIQEILSSNKQNFLVTQQQWGASWEGLEDDIKQSLRQFKGKIYGVELKDPKNEFGGINIDHHSYGQDDDRTNNKSAIEQVAELIGYEMSIEDMFISENDKGYIPAMEKLGIKLHIHNFALKNMIQKIRSLDRQAQGITEQQEQQAMEIIKSINITIYSIYHSTFSKST